MLNVIHVGRSIKVWQALQSMSTGCEKVTRDFFRFLSKPTYLVIIYTHHSIITVQLTFCIIKYQPFWVIPPSDVTWQVGML